MMTDSIKFNRTGTPGMVRVTVNDARVAMIFQREDRAFWYTDPENELALDLDFYGRTLKELKAAICEAIERHEGIDIWHLPRNRVEQHGRSHYTF